MLCGEGDSPWPPAAGPQIQSPRNRLTSLTRTPAGAQGGDAALLLSQLHPKLQVVTLKGSGGWGPSNKSGFLSEVNFATNPSLTKMLGPRNPHFQQRRVTEGTAIPTSGIQPPAQHIREQFTPRTGRAPQSTGTLHWNKTCTFHVKRFGHLAARALRRRASCLRSLGGGLSHVPSEGPRSTPASRLCWAGGPGHQTRLCAGACVVLRGGKIAWHRSEFS